MPWAELQLMIEDQPKTIKLQPGESRPPKPIESEDELLKFLGKKA